MNAPSNPSAQATPSVQAGPVAPPAPPASVATRNLWQPLPDTRDGFRPLGGGRSLVAYAPGEKPAAVRWHPPHATGARATFWTGWTSWVDRVLAARTVRSLTPLIGEFAEALDDGRLARIENLSTRDAEAVQRLGEALRPQVEAEATAGIVGSPAGEVLRAVRWWDPRPLPGGVHAYPPASWADVLEPLLRMATPAQSARFAQAWPHIVGRSQPASPVANTAYLVEPPSPSSQRRSSTAPPPRDPPDARATCWLDLEMALLAGDDPAQVAAHMDRLPVTEEHAARAHLQVRRLLTSPGPDEAPTPREIHLAALRLQLRLHQHHRGVAPSSPPTPARPR